MPTQKDFKRLVRRRIQKTGESYTAARAQILNAPKSARSTTPKVSAARKSVPVTTRGAGAKKAPPAANLTRVSPADYAKVAGVSDATLKTRTGCAWGKWVKSLDYAKAYDWPHRKIATYVHETYGVPGWWAQAVTVGYERIRGLREVGQRRGGAFEASKSRTFPVPVGALYEAFAEARGRAKWLPRVRLAVRKATANKSVRLTWEDGSSVEVWLIAKGDGKSTAQIQHGKLPDKESAARMKVYWTERLDALGRSLTA